MDLYSIRNKRISPNEEFPLALFSLRSCVALLAHGAAYRKKNQEEKAAFLRLFLRAFKSVTLLFEESLPFFRLQTLPLGGRF